MELGEKLKQARLESGLSQRQLCGTEITRNMLSQIEHGTAHPSMTTLSFLASRLGKPVSYFLDEGGAVSRNQECMESAWEAYLREHFEEAQECLHEYREPDPLFDREKQLLSSMILLALAEQAVGGGRNVYAKELLEKVQIPSWLPELNSRRCRVLAQLDQPIAEVLLPNVDSELMLLSRAALSAGNPARAVKLLEAAADHTLPAWLLLRGQAAQMLGRFDEAVGYLQAAEPTYPQETIPALEDCFRELGDYKMAYTYARKQR